MIFLLIIVALLLLISFFIDRKKTIEGIKRGISIFLNLLFPLINILILVSITISIFSQEIIIRVLGNEFSVLCFISAAIIGSVSLIPGFVAYPLCALLIKMGVTYSVIGIFITTLMMVGIITLPFEAKFFGWKISIMRNLLSLIAAVIIGFSIGFIWKFI